MPANAGSTEQNTPNLRFVAVRKRPPPPSERTQMVWTFDVVDLQAHRDDGELRPDTRQHRANPESGERR